MKTSSFQISDSMIGRPCAVVSGGDYGPHSLTDRPQYKRRRGDQCWPAGRHFTVGKRERKPDKAEPLMSHGRLRNPPGSSTRSAWTPGPVGALCRADVHVEPRRDHLHAHPRRPNCPTSQRVYPHFTGNSGPPPRCDLRDGNHVRNSYVLTAVPYHPLSACSGLRTS